VGASAARVGSFPLLLAGMVLLPALALWLVSPGAQRREGSVSAGSSATGSSGSAGVKPITRE
jgi:hypothetical protein